jgi:signal peptidase I
MESETQSAGAPAAADPAEPDTPEPDSVAPEAPAAPAKKKDGIWDTVRFLLFVFIAAVVLRTLIVAPFSIPSGSMLPRLMIGDYIFVAKWPYGYSRFSMPFGIGGFDGRFFAGVPDRGDVVVFRDPGPDNEDIVKRVIGLPGDTVQVTRGEVILNGQRLQRHRIADYLMPVSPNSPCRRVGPEARAASGDGGEAMCAYPRFRETLPEGSGYDVLDQIADGPADNTPVFRVPEGHVFVMGDNRDDSLDSRFSLDQGGVGMVPIERILGRAMITFFSTDGSAQWLLPWTWFSAARWSRIGTTG